MHDLTIVASHTVYAAVVGSRAYGLSGPDSDTDRRGIFQAPTTAFWKLDKPPTHLEGPLPEQFSWELERACSLALAANPTVLECLWSPLVEQLTDVGRDLLSIRGAFLSRQAARTYGDYARDQLNKLTTVRARTGEVRWKQAMHMARLLRAGAHVLREGEILVDVSPWRDELLAIRRGELVWEAFTELAAGLEAQLSEAAAATDLPDEPDRSTVEAFLVAARAASASRVEFVTVRPSARPSAPPSAAATAAPTVTPTVPQGAAPTATRPGTAPRPGIAATDPPQGATATAVRPGAARPAPQPGGAATAAPTATRAGSAVGGAEAVRAAGVPDWAGEIASPPSPTSSRPRRSVNTDSSPRTWSPPPGWPTTCSPWPTTCSP